MFSFYGRSSVGMADGWQIFSHLFANITDHVSNLDVGLTRREALLPKSLALDVHGEVDIVMWISGIRQQVLRHCQPHPGPTHSRAGSWPHYPSLLLHSASRSLIVPLTVSFVFVILHSPVTSSLLCNSTSSIRSSPSFCYMECTFLSLHKSPSSDLIPYFSICSKQPHSPHPV